MDLLGNEIRGRSACRREEVPMVVAALKLRAFWSSSGTPRALVDRILDRTPSCQR
jgi:hypothetical protein